MSDIDEIIFTTARADGLPGNLASMLIAQAKHETGNYTSNVFRTDKNLYGYTWTGSKWQAGKGLVKPEGGFYARYATYADSVHELTDWIKRRQNEGIFPADLLSIQTPQQYAALLKSANYFTDSLTNYANGLIRYFKAFTSTWWIWPVILVGGYFVVKYLVLPNLKK